jgi:hypothetical protein
VELPVKVELLAAFNVVRAVETVKLFAKLRFDPATVLSIGAADKLGPKAYVLLKLIVPVLENVIVPSRWLNAALKLMIPVETVITAQAELVPVDNVVVPLRFNVPVVTAIRDTRDAVLLVALPTVVVPLTVADPPLIFHASATLFAVGWFSRTFPLTVKVLVPPCVRELAVPPAVNVRPVQELLLFIVLVAPAAIMIGPNVVLDVPPIVYPALEKVTVLVPTLKLPLLVQLPPAVKAKFPVANVAPLLIVSGALTTLAAFIVIVPVLAITTPPVPANVVIHSSDEAVLAVVVLYRRTVAVPSKESMPFTVGVVANVFTPEPESVRLPL